MLLVLLLLLQVTVDLQEASYANFVSHPPRALDLVVGLLLLLDVCVLLHLPQRCQEATVHSELYASGRPH